MQVYSAATNQVRKTISRFREVAYSGCFRHDGKLLAAGSEEGVVKVGSGQGMEGVVRVWREWSGYGGSGQGMEGVVKVWREWSR